MVAIGDSLSEGLGDITFLQDRLHNGWADRLAHLLAESARETHKRFEYANLAIRGSKTREIMGGQLSAALRLRPDFVTVMTGANDIFAGTKQLAAIEEDLTAGLQRCRAEGVRVLLLNVVSPGHITVARLLRPRTKRMSQLVNRVGARLGIPVLDVNSMEEFNSTRFWCDDMAHFSSHGHIRIANEAAGMLGLSFRYFEANPNEIAEPDRSISNQISWLKDHVIPFLIRRLKGITSGKGLHPKLPELTSFYAPPSYGEAIRREAAVRIERQSSPR